jgi:hypothetical protein
MTTIESKQQLRKRRGARPNPKAETRNPKEIRKPKCEENILTADDTDPPSQVTARQVNADF